MPQIPNFEVPATERLDQGAKPRLFADNVKLVEVVSRLSLRIRFFTW